MASSAWCATTSTAAAPPSATTTRSSGYSARRSTCAASTRNEVRSDLRARTNPAKLHRAHQLARQDLERAQRSRLAGRHRAKERRAAGEHRLRAERARFQDVHAAAHAAVEQHGHAVAYRARDRRQRIEGRGGAIELASAVVGHDHTVAADG